MTGNDVVLVSGVRTAIGGFGGSLKGVRAVDLGAVVIRGALAAAGLDGTRVDNVIMGMVVSAGAGQAPARQASIGAGLPVAIPSETVNKVCASGMRAVTLGAAMIACGEASVVVAGGMESMSQAPYLVRKARWGHRMGHGEIEDAMISDGLWCPIHNVHMAVHGSKVASEYGISRQAQDEWAVWSQQRTARAIAGGILAQEIVPVSISERGEERVFDTDECPRPGTTIEALSGLKPVFDPCGSITAGNAPGVNDGAAALVVMSRTRASELGLKPLASIAACGAASAEPQYIATVPALAARKALARAGMTIRDIDLIEINEAFAAVVLTSLEILGGEPERVNVNGGAIALGHPIGATGARILLSLMHEMRRRNVEFGLAAICSGGAQGDCVILRAES